MSHSNFSGHPGWHRPAIAYQDQGGPTSILDLFTRDIDGYTPATGQEHFEQGSLARKIYEVLDAYQEKLIAEKEHLFAETERIKRMP